MKKTVARKSSKPMKAKKAVRRTKKAKKATVVGKKWQVWKGTRERTVGGLTKADLMMNKNGKVVSKKMSKKAKSAGGLNKWTAAVQRARKELKISGFCAIKKGTPLYDLARKYYA